jgi:hypothetical protein
VDVPFAGFTGGAFLRLHEQVADVGEGGGTARGDAIGGESFKEFAEDVVDIDLSDEIAGGAGEFSKEIVFPMEGAAMDGAMVEAESIVTGMSGHAAAFAVGELKSAEVVRRIWSSIGHEESIQKRKGTDKLVVEHMRSNSCGKVIGIQGKVSSVAGKRFRVAIAE